MQRLDARMRTRLQTPARLAACLAAAGALALTACSDDDDGGGGSTDAFCAELTQLAESGADTTEEEDLAALRAVAGAAPGEISDEMNELVSGFEELQAFDPEAATEDEFTDFLAIADSLDQAAEQVETFAQENCPDLPAELFSTE